MTKYFECKTELCGGALCCTIPRSKPALSLGDFYRLSEHTGEPLPELWKSKGDLFPYTGDLPAGLFCLTLSLLHDPCPYLKETKCEVHEIKPTGCANFPDPEFPHQKGSQEMYPCLRDVKLSSEQITRRKQLQDIQEIEVTAEAKYFWKEQPIVINAYTPSDFFELVGQAVKIQQKKDSPAQSPRSQRLILAADKMARLVESGDIKTKGLTPFEYSSLLAPVVFPIFEEEVLEMLSNLDERLISLFEYTAVMLNHVKE